MQEIICQEYESPCGSLLLGAAGDRLCICDWNRPDRLALTKQRMKIELVYGNNGINDRAARQLDEYFAGKRTTFDIPLLLIGTDFRKRVWDALGHIAYGKTVCYSDVASMLGEGSSVRAVATAIGANPLSIFIPCHRVIGKSGSLTGYAGGLEAKKYLLELEG